MDIAKTSMGTRFRGRARPRRPQTTSLGALVFRRSGNTSNKNTKNLPKNSQKETKQYEQSFKKATWKHTGKGIGKSADWGLKSRRPMRAAGSGVIAAGGCGNLFGYMCQIQNATSQTRLAPWQARGGRIEDTCGDRTARPF